MYYAPIYNQKLQNLIHSWWTAKTQGLLSNFAVAFHYAPKDDRNSGSTISLLQIRVNKYDDDHKK